VDGLCKGAAPFHRRQPVERLTAARQTEFPSSRAKIITCWRGSAARVSIHASRGGKLGLGLRSLILCKA